MISEENGSKEKIYIKNEVLNYLSISRYQHLWVGIRSGLWLYHYHQYHVSPLLIYHYQDFTEHHQMRII